MAAKSGNQQISKKWSDLFDKTASTDNGGQVIATIEIHHETSQQPTTQCKTASFKNSTEVNPEALKVAQHLYITQLDTITKTKTRSDLNAFYDTRIDAATHQKLSELGIGFREVLYAMAKGMKVVNVFRRQADQNELEMGWHKSEQEMGWHKPEEKYRNLHKESKKRLQPQPDGWTNIGVPPPIAEIKKASEPEPEPKNVVEKSATQTNKQDVQEIQVIQPAKYQPNEEDGKLDDDAIISEIKSLKLDIENHLGAIDSLVPIHDDHAVKISIIETNPCDVAKRVVEYHKHARDELVTLLDNLQFELDAMKARKVWLCEQLKN